MAETCRRSNLGRLKAGDLVNLENDIVGKYVEKLLGLGKEEKEEGSGGITMDFLREYGI